MTQEYIVLDGIKLTNINYLCRNYTGSKRLYKFEELIEYPYYSKILINLKNLLKDEFFRYKFFIYSKIIQKISIEDYDLVPNNRNEKLIIFFISDETGEIPKELADKSKIVFKALLKQNNFNNIYYFPLGYGNGQLKQIKPINQRSNNVFFIGQLGRSRIDLYKELLGFKFVPDIILLALKKNLPRDFSNAYKSSFIKFTTGFGKGLTTDEYNNILYDSKIVICPYGAVTPETFRHYEAMRAGCIVITLKMPPVFPFEYAPIIQLENWGQLKTTISNLIDNPYKMQKMHEDVLSWWNDKCSEESVARYLYEKIKAT